MHAVQNETTIRPSLVVEDVSVKYQQQFGCEHIHFKAFPGERIAVIGPNGAGKSSLFKAIVGLQPIFDGSIRIADQPLHKKDNQVSYVPQHEGVDWHFPVSVWDTVMMVRTRQIGLFLPPRSRDRQVVRHALEQTNLWDLRYRQIGELSGGQRRRIFIARALAQEATLMLMDEPFIGVDATVEEELFRVLDILREREITVLIATHNLAQAASHYDRILMINRHQIAYGTPEEVYTADNLSETFGGRVSLWQEEGRTVMISDHPCHEHDEARHA